jgi:hypothetical protein
VNAQELFLDVSSGRFLDGESTIPTNKPTFYSDEVRSTKINLRKVNNNKLSSVTGSLGSSLKVRLGTSTAKLADGTIPGASTLPLIKASATIVTISSTQASATGSVTTFANVTATITAGISTNSVVSKTPEFGTFLNSATTRLAQFSANIQVVTAVTATAKTLVNLPALVTPTITASIAGSVVPTGYFVIANTNAYNIFSTPLDLAISPINPVTFSAVLNTPIAATFTSTITGGSVTTIAISGIGNGYPNGTYSLTFVGASTTSASGSAVALGGKIVSVSLDNGGTGYSANPSITLFTPDKTLLSVLPSNYIGKIDGKDSFTWVAPTTTTARADLLFTVPTSSSIVTGLSVPSAFISFYTPSITGNPTWQITIVCGGYGYIATPTVSRESILVNAQNVSRKVNVASAGLEYVGYRNNTFGTANVSGLGLKTISLNESFSTKAVSLENGGLYFTLQNETRINSLFDIKTNKYPIIDKTSITQPILLDSKVSLAQQQELTPYHNIYAGRNNIYVAVVPKDGKAPSRYAILKISTSPINESYRVISGFERYYNTSLSEFWWGSWPFPYKPGINPTYIDEAELRLSSIVINTVPKDANLLGYTGKINSTSFGNQQSAGGGVYEPTIEIVDFGSGYQSSSFASGFSLIELGSLTSNIAFLSDSRSREISVSTTNFYPTLVSKQLGVATRPSSGTIQYYIGDGGFGYFGGGLVSVGQTSGVTGVVSVSLLTQPKGYSPGEYILTTQQPPSGTTATVAMVIPNYGNPYVYVQNAGSGYTSIPTITAPSPNILSGNVNFAYVTNSPQGYSLNNKHYFSVQSSPSQGGSAVIYMQNNQAYIESQGFGYTTAPIVTAPAPDISISCSGYISSIRVSTRGLGYQRSLVLPLDIEPSPVSGGNAQAAFYFQGDDCLIDLYNPGFGYTTSPVITAPQPNISSACLGMVNVYIKSPGSGYYDGTPYYLQFTPPPTGGVAPIAKFFSISGSVVYVNVDSGGYGYVTAPTVQAPLPDFQQTIYDQGFISNIGLTNNPVGYQDGTYSLTVVSSPSSGGTAIVSLVVVDGSYGFSIQNKGYGYATAPFITAPTPNALQGQLASISITTIGRGYAPSTIYDCIVDSAPSSGQTAQVQFYSASRDSGEFVIINKGYGYTSAVNISVPTPQGSVLSSISIVCGGSFYSKSTASYSISDASGTGYSLGEIVLSAGAVQSIQVIDGGRGFGSSPKINFSMPTRPVLASYPPDVIAAEFNITTASANTILSTSTQKDILMEVFETDGTNEQVISQATVSLAKRVLE